jgi:hypothetical protein
MLPGWLCGGGRRDGLGIAPRGVGAIAWLANLFDRPVSKKRHEEIDEHRVDGLVL